MSNTFFGLPLTFHSRSSLDPARHARLEGIMAARRRGLQAGGAGVGRADRVCCGDLCESAQHIGNASTEGTTR